MDNNNVQGNKDSINRKTTDVVKRVAKKYGGALGGAAAQAVFKTKTGQNIVGLANQTFSRTSMGEDISDDNSNSSILNPMTSSSMDMDSDESVLNDDGQDVSDNSSDDISTNNNVEGKGIISGLWKKSSFKTKLVIIGVVFAFVSLIMFLIILITPLMHLGIIEVKGGTSSHAYINPSYGYCDSINVEGNLIPLEEYVAGVVQAEVGIFMNDSNADEALKALSIAARTYAIYYTNGCKKSIPNGDTAQVVFLETEDNKLSEKAVSIANSTAGLVMTYNNDLFLSEYDSFCTRCSDLVANSDGSYTVTYTKPPTGDKHSITLSDMTYKNNIFDGVGHGHGRGMSQYVAVQYSKEGMSYEEILNTFYSDGVEIVKLEKLLVGNVGTEQGLDYIGTYTNVKNGKTYKNYKQYLYRSEEFTFEGKDHLASVGCGTNAAAIVLSGEDSSITPMSLYIENGRAVGTYFGDHYPYRKESFSYCNNWSDGYCLETKSSTKIGNAETKEKLISNLNNGGTAILFINYSADKCTVRGESWTGSQHFFSVLDYNSVDDTIFISNPGTNSTSQNGWIALDEFDCVHIAWLMYPE